MRVYLDSEFTDLRQSAKLISLALITEDSRFFYAEWNDYSEENLSDWVKFHVLGNLLMSPPKPGEQEYFSMSRVDKGTPLTVMNNIQMRGNTTEIVHALREWLEQFDKVEIWGDCLAYDWVLFCELFGGSLNLPDKIYYIPFDISDLLMFKGIDPDIGRTMFAKGYILEHKESMSLLKSLSVDRIFFDHNSFYDALIIRAIYKKLAKEEK
jgi:hypothetical protein